MDGYKIRRPNRSLCTLINSGIHIIDQPLRATLKKQAADAGLRSAPPMVAPYVYYAPSASIGKAVVIGNFVTLGSRARLEQHVMIMNNTNIGHDTVVGELSVICSGVRLGGYARIGQGVFIGPNAVVAPGVKIGDGAILSAGVVCLKDIPEGASVIGNPARRITPKG